MRVSVGRWLVLCWALVLLGCGGSQESFVVVGPVGPEGGGGALTGRFDLGVGVPQARIEIRSLDGAVLAQTGTNRSGHFLISGVALPSDFRVLATLGSALEFSSEVRGYDGSGRDVILNVPTSLASSAVQSLGLSLAESESRVRALLRYPQDLSLERPGLESHASPFSHLAFFEEAAGQGGWIAYRDRLVAAMGASGQIRSTEGNGRYRFRPELLSADFSGLEVELLLPLVAVTEVATYTANDGTTGTDASPMQYMGLVLEGLSDEVLAQLFPDDDQVSGQAVRPKLLDSLLDTLGEGAKGQLIDVGWTHIADALNLNYGTTRMLEVIQEQLDQVLSDLAHLEGQLDELAIEDTVNTLAPAVARIQSEIQALANQDPQALADPNTPYTPSNAVQTLLSTLANSTAAADLTLLQNTLSKDFFQNSVLTYLYNVELGINDLSSYGNAPFLSAAIQSRALTPFNYYGQSQQSACKIISENAHSESPNPFSDMNAANTIAQQAAEQLKLQRGFVPWQLMSNYVIVDLQAGLMWYTQVYDATTWSDAVYYAENCSLTVGNGVTYSDWRLPTVQDFEVLQDRARLVATNRRDSAAPHDGNDASYGNYGYSLQGLAALGFDKNGVATLVNSDGSFLCEPASYEDDRWVTNYNIFRLNHESSSQKVISSQDRYPFILCRSIGTNPVNFPNYGPDRSGVVPFRVSPILPQEFPMLGHATSLANVQEVNGIMGATVTYTIQVGGSFSMGTNNEDRRNYPVQTYTQAIDSFPGGSNDHSGPYDLMEMISFVSQSPLLTIGSTGKLLWHVDDVAARTVTVNATMNSATGTQLTASGTINSTPAARQITKVQVWPRNRYYSVIGGKTTDESYYCLAYYDDNTIADVTGQVTWSTNSPNAGVTFSNQQANDLKIDGTLNPAQFVDITATLPGTTFSDTTGIEVVSQ